MKQVDSTDKGWDDMVPAKPTEKDPTPKTDGDSLFMRLVPREKPYRVRLVSNPHVFRQHFFKLFTGLTMLNGKIVKSGVNSPAKDVPQKDLDIAWSKGGHLPARRGAAVVINREASRCQLLEGGPDIFDPIKQFQDAAEVNPSSNDGPDFLIWVKEVIVKGKGGKEGKKREYKCIADPKNPRTPFTDEEKVLIDKFPEDWKKWFALASPEEMENLWNQLSDDRKYSPNQRKWLEQHGGIPASKPAPQPEPKPAEEAANEVATPEPAAAEAEASDEQAEGEEDLPF